MAFGSRHAAVSGGEVFRDREDAGRQLGARVALLLREHAGEPAGTGDGALAPALVLGLPRGGVIVAREVAAALARSGFPAALDVFVVRKIGAPWQPELALGAVADVAGQAQVVLNRQTINALGVDDAYLLRATAQEHEEALRRLAAYRGARPAPRIEGRIVIVVDDGIATGATVRAALQVLRGQQPRRLILAVPVAPPDTLQELRRDVDDIVCLSAPPYFSAVGRSYHNFEQTSDEEVVDALAKTRTNA